MIHSNAFADGRNLDLAWADSKKFLESTFVREFTENGRCAEDAPPGARQCILLNSDDLLYMDIREWLGRRDEICPAS